MDLISRIKQLFGSGGSAKDKPAAPAKPVVAAVKKQKVPKVDIKKRFDLLRPMGQGSMSKVWQARDLMIGRTVCLKLLDKLKTAKFEMRFLGANKPPEGEICALMRHENIVQTYEHGVTTENQAFVVMELIEGTGLNFLTDTRSDKLNGRRIKYLSQLCDALEYVHNAGYLHRDICPRNVMVDVSEQIKLIDFGLAIPNTPFFLKPGNRTGTPTYLAPELIRRTTTDHRVDLYALGVTAYEVITFGLPWEKAQSMQTLLSHMNTPGRDPRELKPDIDNATRDFLIQAIQRDPRDRFQTVREFREALQQLPPKL